MSASVALALDTRPPVIKVTAREAVEPPDDLVVGIEADESLGAVSLALIDALGRLFNLGYERLTDRTLVARVGTVGLASGLATLRVSAADEVLNFAEASVKIMVRRPRAYDVDLTIDGAYGIDFSRDGAYETVLTTEPAHHSSLEVS